MGKTLIRPGQIKPFTEAEAIELFSQTLYNLALLKSNATKEELDHLSGITSSIQAQLNNKLNKSSLVGDGLVDWTSDLTTATSLAISKRIASEVANAQIGGAMLFKGRWSTKITPSTATPIRAGYTYTYDSGVGPAGVSLEVGDMLTASVDITTPADVSNAINWVIVQTNISGAISTIEQQLTEGRLIVGGGGKTVAAANITGILKATAGVPTAATKQDVSNVVGAAITIGNSDKVGQFNLMLGDILSIAQSGGANISFDATNKRVTIFAPPAVSIPAGAAVSNQYISGITIDSNGVIAVTRASMPADVSIVSKTTTSIAGLKNGTNRTFTMPENAAAGSVMLFLNGQCLVQGVDYTLSGAGNKTITFAVDANIPVATDVLSVNYVKI